MEGIMALTRRAQQITAGGVREAVKPEGFRLNYPMLADHLFDLEFEDGTKRQRSTLTIMAGDVSGLKAVLNDRTEKLSLWATGLDIDDVLLTMEALLCSKDAPWKQDNRQENQKKTK
jgi:hypothetical protein